MSAVPTFSADDLAVVAVDTQADRMVIAAYQGDAIPMSHGQFGQLVEAAKSGMVIGRRAVLRAIEPKDGDDAHN